MWNVESIEGKRLKNGQTQYLIKWKGFSRDWDTWEPMGNLQECFPLIEKFEECLAIKKSHKKFKKKCPLMSGNSPKSDVSFVNSSSDVDVKHALSQSMIMPSGKKVKKSGVELVRRKSDSAVSNKMTPRNKVESKPKSSSPKSPSKKAIAAKRKNDSTDEAGPKAKKKKTSESSALQRRGSGRSHKENSVRKKREINGQKKTKMSETQKKKPTATTALAKKVLDKSKKTQKNNVVKKMAKKVLSKSNESVSIKSDTKNVKMSKTLTKNPKKVSKASGKDMKNKASPIKEKEKIVSFPKVSVKRMKNDGSAEDGPRKKKMVGNKDAKTKGKGSRKESSSKQTMKSEGQNKGSLSQVDGGKSAQESCTVTEDVKLSKNMSTSPKKNKSSQTLNSNDGSSQKSSKKDNSGNIKDKNDAVQKATGSQKNSKTGMSAEQCGNVKESQTVIVSGLKGKPLEGGQPKRKALLIDSVKKKKKPSTSSGSNTAAVHVFPFNRPVSPTPLFTTVKPILTKPGCSGIAMDTLCGDVPMATYQYFPTVMPLSPTSMSYRVLLENLPQQLHPKQKSKKLEGDNSAEEVERRISVRQSECAFRYKEIVVKKCTKYTQIWLNTHTKVKNVLNPLVIQEIVSALNSAKFDDSNLVLFSGLGNVFCQGVDLHFLTTGDRKVAARQMVDAVRDFAKALITFPKPIIAVVTGSAVGLGVSMLPLCDIIYASDKAMFHLPYSQLAQTPEGGATFSLPSTVGMAMANELLIGGRKLTAIEACQLGLVSQVFWPTTIMEEVIPRVQNLAHMSGKSLETTKLLMRSHQRTKLELTNESECNLLLERWPSADTQKAIEGYLSNDKNFLS